MPELTTRSLAFAVLIVSALALLTSFAVLFSVPPSSSLAVRALRLSPKEALANALTARDQSLPGQARAYYRSRTAADYTVYTHATYGVSLPYPRDFRVAEIAEEAGELILFEHPAVGLGFQLFITPDDDPEPLTAARIRRDLPDLPMEEVVEFTLSDGTAAVRFVIEDRELGTLSETWFRRGGQLVEITVSAKDRELQDAWIREIAGNLTFSNPTTDLKPAVTPDTF